MTERDKQICLCIYEHRFLTTHQASRLFFTSYPRARDRLHKLHQMRVLERFRPHRPTGSHPWYYVLDEVGLQILSAEKGIEAKELGYDIAKALRQVYSPRLAHTSEVNDFFTRLAERAQEQDGSQLVTWLGERGCEEAWKSYVRPDGFGELETAVGKVSFFLELDRGTETHPRLAQKLEGYGSVAGMSGTPNVVLFCFPSPRREALARKSLYECGITVATGVFARHKEDPFARIWLLVGTDGRTTLKELADPKTRRQIA